MKQNTLASPPLGPIGALAQVGVEELPEMVAYDEDLCCCRDDDALLGLLQRLFEEGRLDLATFWELADAFGF